MGNKIGRRRQVVDDKYTRPQGLYQHRDIDHKKLRKLILDSKLAPCYPGDDDCSFDLEECPICFLYYPSLNRSRCCMKGICTECFLQMKPPHSTRPTQCPFCKTSNYAVEYRGVKTKEEKGIEQVEEQKVIEAQIRMRQQELQDAEEKMQKRQDLCSSSTVVNAGEVEYQDVANSSAPSFRCSSQTNDIVPSEGSFTVPTSRQPSHSRQNREDNFDLDLEDIMVMEAIWLSIQEGSGPRNQVCGSSENCQMSCPMEASPSGGLACTVAALAERQHMSEDIITTREERSVQNYPSQRWIEVSPNTGRALAPEEESDDNVSDTAEAGTSYASSDIIPLHENVSVNNIGSSAVHLVPESYEEQVMLAMAVSLAEARARTGPQSLTWM